MGAAEKISDISDENHISSSFSNSTEYIKKRFSEELIIGVCGYVGSGFRSFVKELEDAFSSSSVNFEVHIIRVSELIKAIVSECDLEITLADDLKTKPSERYLRYQEAGDKIRKKFSVDFLAKAVISEITKKQQEYKEKNNIDTDEKKIGKQVFIIDQLKSHKEIELLRLVYPNNYFQFSLIRNEEERENNLKDEGISSHDIANIIEKDKSSVEEYGQKTQKAILEGDFFIHNRHGNNNKQKIFIKRCIGLILGENGLTPTMDEKGMYEAFSASMNSACLSRQVGAALLNDDGNTLATGKNDVPKPFGGLYNTSSDTTKDHRCIYRGNHCYSDSRKETIKNNILNILKKYDIKIRDDIKEDINLHIANEIFRETPLSSITEYSRAVHAEMDVITSLARNKGETTKDKTLYTTTFPCHNCARHIIASGIKRVVYIEPYEKSLATLYHDDAITAHREIGKVIFDNYEGVSPKRYQIFFLAQGQRKDSSGRATTYTNQYGPFVTQQPLDDYNKYQLAVFKEVTEEFERLKKGL